MKFNITAKKLNEVDVNVTFELTPDEMISVLKQGSDDLRVMLLHKDEIVDAVTTILNCYTENVIKTRTHVEEVK